MKMTTMDREREREKETTDEGKWGTTFVAYDFQHCKDKALIWFDNVYFITVYLFSRNSDTMNCFCGYGLLLSAYQLSRIPVSA